MASLALKAIAYGADKIPDKFFESIPGGYYKDKEQKERDKRDKRERRKSHKDRSTRDRHRSHSEGRPRRKSPSPSDSEYDYSDRPDTDEDESDHDRRRNRRRGRDRDRRRDRTTALAEEEEYLDLPPPKKDRSKSMSYESRPYYPMPPKPDLSQPAPNLPPGQVKPAEHSPYRPYNPAEYAAGPVGVQPPPLATISPQNGYYSPLNHSPATGTFPVRTSRASSVGSRGHNPAPYIPHANVYQPQQPSYQPSAYATAAGSPYSTASPSAISTPAYVPQSSSPYNPGYSAAYAPVPHGYATQPVSRHGSVSQHPAVPAVPAGYVSQPVTRQGSVDNGGGGGGGASHHSNHHERRHDHPEHRRRHSVGFQEQDPRLPIRQRGSSNVSFTGSPNVNPQNRFESLPEHFDGAYEQNDYLPIGSAAKGSSEWEVGRKSEQRRRHGSGRSSRHTRY